jgi:hypothetical protein
MLTSIGFMDFTCLQSDGPLLYCQYHKGFVHQSHPTSRDEFYDLEMDPWETKNIISSADKDKLAWAKKTLLAWMKETEDHPLYRWAYPILNDKPEANR